MKIKLIALINIIVNDILEHAVPSATSFEVLKSALEFQKRINEDSHISYDMWVYLPTEKDVDMIFETYAYRHNMKLASKWAKETLSLIDPN